MTKPYPATTAHPVALIATGERVLSAETLAASAVGRTITAVRRLQYIYHGTVYNGNGAIEVTFDDGVTVVLDAGGDGESLAIEAGAWVDPFAEPLSDENRVFVKKSGKWTGFDMTKQDSYVGVVDRRVDEVRSIISPTGKVIGIFMRMGERLIRIGCLG